MYEPTESSSIFVPHVEENHIVQIVLYNVINAENSSLKFVPSALGIVPITCCTFALEFVSGNKTQVAFSSSSLEIDSLSKITNMPLHMEFFPLGKNFKIDGQVKGPRLD